MNLVSARKSRFDYGGVAPAPQLYGIWDVEKMTIDGAERPALSTDYERWRRVIIQDSRAIALQRMDNSLIFYPATTDVAAKTITLTRSADQRQKTQLEFDRTASQSMLLSADVDGHKIHMTLRLFDHTKLRLLNRGFNWVQEYPYNW